MAKALHGSLAQAISQEKFRDTDWSVKTVNFSTSNDLKYTVSQDDMELHVCMYSYTIVH